MGSLSYLRGDPVGAEMFQEILVARRFLMPLTGVVRISGNAIPTDHTETNFAVWVPAEVPDIGWQEKDS
jgi:hypothetical protein